ncbi:hypothetical protein [Flavobacterium cheonhonense]|uniref:hypothetical protein n=1 Tax=Flavobacterium cheonhonense TaxID=706185 RepID=UPI0031EF7592
MKSSSVFPGLLINSFGNRMVIVLLGEGNATKLVLLIVVEGVAGHILPELSLQPSKTHPPP